MKTTISLILLMTTSNAIASDCSIKIYYQGELVREVQPVLFDRKKEDTSPACYELVERVMAGKYQDALKSDVDAIEFSYVNRAGKTIHGSLQK